MKAAGFILLLILAATVAWWWAGKTNVAAWSSAPTAPTIAIKSSAKRNVKPLPKWARTTKGNANTAEQEAEDNSFFGKVSHLLMGQEPDTKKLAAFLASHGHSTDALLAVWRITQNKTYLEQAQRKSPTDPRVLEALAYATDEPNSRAGVIEAYRLAAPEDPKPLLLAAKDALKAGEAQLALDELLLADELLTKGTNAHEAREKQALLDSKTSLEAWLATTDLKPDEAKYKNIISEPRPMLTTYTELSKSISEWMMVYSATGDQAAALELGQVGLRLKDSIPGKALIDDLVRMTVEERILQQFPRGTTVPGSTAQVEHRLQEIARHKQAIRDASKESSQIMQQASRPNLSAYLQVLERDGELAALNWLKTQR
jgi:hypothetical protein